MNIVAKFKVLAVEHTKPENSGDEYEYVALEAVTEGEENAEWSKYTPSGQLQMTVTNEKCFGQFVEGEEVYLTLSKELPVYDEYGAQVESEELHPLEKLLYLCESRKAARNAIAEYCEFNEIDLSTFTLPGSCARILSGLR
jgi:hypothetical protein